MKNVSEMSEPNLMEKLLCVSFAVEMNRAIRVIQYKRYFRKNMIS